MNSTVFAAPIKTSTNTSVVSVTTRAVSFRYRHALIEPLLSVSPPVGLDGTTSVSVDGTEHQIGRRWTRFISYSFYRPKR